MPRTTSPRPRLSRSSRWIAAAVVGATLTACSPGPGALDPAQCGRTRVLDRTELVSLTSDGRLVCLDVSQLDRSRLIGSVTGLDGGESLVGIDFRSPFTDAMGVSNGVPTGGTLYGLGRSGGIYALDAKTGVATKKSQLGEALDGTNFAIDFNPTVDRLRIVSDSGQNLRVNVDTGATIVDGTLNVAGLTATGVAAVAYTNVDSDPSTATTLYDIDVSTDQLMAQNPPNAGTLVSAGTTLGADAEAPVGFDLYSRVRPTSSVPGAPLTTVDVTGYVTMRLGGVPTVFEVTPFSGRARVIGAIPFAAPVIDIAAPLAQ